MTKEEYIEKISAIKEKTHEMDDGFITNILAELADDYVSLLSQVQNTNLQNEKLKNDNDNLRDTNMRLFLRVGSEQVPPEHEEGTKREFSNLFNEKGELK